MKANDEEYDILIGIVGEERIELILLKLPGFTFNTDRLKAYRLSIRIYQAFRDGLSVKVIKAMFNFSRKRFKAWKDKFEALTKKK